MKKAMSEHVATRYQRTKRRLVAIQQTEQKLRERAKAEREKLATWMIENGFATGHGDTFDDLLKELAWQVKELRDKIWELEKP